MDEDFDIPETQPIGQPEPRLRGGRYYGDPTLVMHGPLVGSPGDTEGPATPLVGDPSLADYGRQQPGQDLTNAAAASIPDPWGPADDLHLTRLNNDASKVREEFGTGNLDQQAFDGLMGQINKARQPMLQRQQQAKQAAQAEQQQQAMHQNAFAKSIQAQDSQFDAANFAKSVGSFTDPETGRTAHFAPKGAQQIDFGEDDAEPDADADEAPPELQPNPDGSHTLTIQNGAGNIERHTYAPDGRGGMRIVASEQLDGRTGRPVQPPGPSPAAGNPDGTLSDAQRQDIQKKALGLVGPPPPQFDRAGRPNGQYTEWMKRVDGEARRMADEQTRLNTARVRNQMAVTEAMRKEAVKKAARPTVHDLAKQFDFSPHDTIKMIADEEKTLAQEPTGGGKPIGKTGNATTPETTWANLPREELHKEAVRRVMDRLRSMKGDAVEPGAPEPSGGTNGPPEPAVAPAAAPARPAVKPLPKGATTESDTDAAIARRTPQQPGFMQRIFTPSGYTGSRPSMK